MAKPQIVVRIPPMLLARLNDHAAEMGTTRTDVVVDALRHYFGESSEPSLSERVQELEKQVQQLQRVEQ
ncbi:MAG: DNA-binding domain-containing protein [Cyanobacteria bacterium P01_F01_bin.150]